MSLGSLREFNNLTQDIMAKASLSSQEATGFYAVHCHVCNKADKKTGGWKFEDDKIIYNCFRGSCDGSTVYEYGKPVPRKFKALMELIHVSIPMPLLMVRTQFQRLIASLDDDLYKKHEYNTIELDDTWVEFKDAKPYLQDIWSSKMKERCVPYHDCYISIGGKYRGCLGIPMKSRDRLIGLQVLTQQGVYIMIGGGNSHILYMPDGFVPSTVLVVEGTMDAKCFPSTVATLRHNVTPEQAYFLRGKDVILLPDRTGNHFIDQHEEYGWKVCIPPWEEKDLNSAVMKYGHPTVARMIVEHTYTNPLKIKTEYKLWQKK